MHPHQRIVTAFSIDQLWNDAGPVVAVRQRDLAVTDARELLRLGPVQFVVANIGEKLRWIPLTDSFSFWKQEVQSHLAEPDTSILLRNYPGEYCYLASEWLSQAEEKIVLLERIH